MKLHIDTSNCTSCLDGSHYFKEKNLFDSWRYKDLDFESGKMYAIVSEYGQGCMFLAYLLGGKIPFENVKISKDDIEISQKDLSEIGWNLEPTNEKYGNSTARKSVEGALKITKRNETFSDIQKRFRLTDERVDRKIKSLSGERWRASAALGYALEKEVFFAPYCPSNFYYQMYRTGSFKVLQELAANGGIVVLPVGTDSVLKHLVDECIYLDAPFVFDKI